MTPSPIYLYAPSQRPFRVIPHETRALKKGEKKESEVRWVSLLLSCLYASPLLFFALMNLTAYWKALSFSNDGLSPHKQDSEN